MGASPMDCMHAMQTLEQSVSNCSQYQPPCDVCGPLAQGVAGIFHGATQQQERVFIMQRKALPLALLVLYEVLYWLDAATWTASLCRAGHDHGWVFC